MTVVAHGWRPSAAVPGGVHFSYVAAEAAAHATGCQPSRLGGQVSLRKPELDLTVGFWVALEDEKRK